MNKFLKWKILSLFLFISVSLLGNLPVRSQDMRRAIDMMILIDNSCSMFPRNQILPGCTSWGSDPNFLRISGADLFIARLGFSEANETEYQVGVIGIGAEAKLISPLQPVSKIRDSLAALINKPSPEGATQIVPAIETAYKELRTSPNRKPTNLPAIILITDGVPWPSLGQGNNDITELIKNNPDIPIFIMLLQGAEERSQEYQDYINFWQNMQLENKHVFVYPVETDNQIEGTYNEIIAQLQNTIPTQGIQLAKDQPLSIFVSQYVQTIVVTIVHQTNNYTGNVSILDPTGIRIGDAELGVGHFRGDRNPIEVISISNPRLSANLKESFWTIVSDEPVVVFLDREGAYKINITAPEVGLTDINNVYIATHRQTPKLDLPIRFRLVLENGNAVTEKQPIQGKVVFPNGKGDNLRIPSNLMPDQNGFYEIKVDFAGLYPDILKRPGRFILEIQAGSADDRTTERMPIANARLLVDVGPGPYISQVLPVQIQCKPGELTNQVSIKLGDYDTVLKDTARLRIFGQGSDVTLTQASSGEFTGDINSLCMPLIKMQACSTNNQTVFQMRFAAQLQDGSAMLPLEVNLPVEIFSVACTPTPLPMIMPTLTPIPDSDHDGFNDLVDQCKDQPVWLSQSQFQGCPPPLWVVSMIGGALVFFVFILVFYIWPNVRVLYFDKPPKAYVMACRNGKSIFPPKAIHNIGIEHKTSAVTIGGSKKKAHIYVAGLKDVEFVVIQKSGRVEIIDYETKIVKGIFGETTPSVVSTSQPEIILRICLKQENMRC